MFEWRRGIKINVKALFLPRQASLYGLERNDVSNLVKKGCSGLVWLLVGFYFFLEGLSFKLGFLCEIIQFLNLDADGGDICTPTADSC